MSLQRDGGLDPKIINKTCDTEENGTTTCIDGNPHDAIIGIPLVRKGQSSTYLVILKL